MNTPPIQQITVVGAGLMGHGIALEFALAGLDVVLHDLAEVALQRAQSQVVIALQRLAQLGLVHPEAHARAPRHIRYTVDLPTAVSDAHLVIESALESLDVKRRIFADLDRLCPARAILASNSSSLVPSSYASATHRPAKVLGVHYFNPPYLIPCVEVIPGPETAEATLRSVRELLVHLGKQVVMVRREVPGFIANRLQTALFREAVSLVERGVATPEEVDKAVHYGIGRRFAVAGPFEVFDLAGLDTLLAVGRKLMPDIESAPTISPLLEGMVQRGELGLKTGKGFHTWTPDASQALQHRLIRGLARQAQATHASRTQREPFVGAWRLVSFEANKDGLKTFPLGADATGLLVYTLDGHMSVILSRASRTRLENADPMAGTAEEKAAAFESCFAYAGKFEVEEDRVVHRLEHCTFPDWMGSEQVRFFRFEANRLILETPPQVLGGRTTVSRLTWERV